MRWIVLALTAVCAAASSAAAQDSLVVQRLAGADTNQQNWFGYAASISEAGGDVLVLIGAPRARPLTTGAGYVFRRDAATGLFMEEAKLQGSVNASQGEDVALLEPTSGAAGPSNRWLALVGGGQPGHLWRRQVGGIWTYVARLLPPGNTYEYGGRAVGVARDRAGAEYAALSEGDSLYAWRRAPNAPDDASGWLPDGGFSVVPFLGLSLERGMLAMWAGLDGAVRLAFPVATNPLAVVIFARDPATGTWAEETRLYGSALLPGHRFGHSSVAGGVMSAGPGGEPDEYVLVGAPYWVEPYDRPGRAYLFRRDAGSAAWVEEAALQAPPGSGAHTFGLGGSFHDGVLVVAGISRFWTFTHGLGGEWAPTGMVETFQTYGVADRTGTALSLPYLVMGDAFNDDLGFQAGAAWVFTLPGSLTPAEPASAPATLTLSVSPQPAENAVRVRYGLPSPAPARLALQDVLGRVVWRTEAPAGAAGVTLDAGALAAGMYVLRLEAGGQAVARSVVVAR